MRKNLFITFEGGEGAGKSTQIGLLQQRLADKGISVVRTREPGGSEGAEIIRELFVKGATDRWTAMSEALLVTAARVDHVERTIKPALAAGNWVLCDRFYDSTVVYQGAARGLGVKEMQTLQNLALGNFVPNLTIFLDMPVDEGLARAGVREDGNGSGEDRFERAGTAFHQTIRKAYLALSKAEDNRYRCICGLGSVEEVAERIWDQVAPVLSLSGEA